MRYKKLKKKEGGASAHARFSALLLLYVVGGVGCRRRQGTQPAPSVEHPSAPVSFIPLPSTNSFLTREVRLMYVDNLPFVPARTDRAS